MSATEIAQLLSMVATGTVSTLYTQFASNVVPAAKASMLLIWCKYLAQVLVLIVSKDSAAAPAVSKQPDAAPAKSRKLSVHAYLIIISVLDIAGSVLSLWGTVLLGSGLYQVIHSSQLISTCILAKMVLKKDVKLTQWAGIFMVTAGLAVSPMGSFVGKGAAAGAIDASWIIGFICTLAYALVCSLQNVLCVVMNRRAQELQQPEVGPVRLAATIGWYGIIATSAYIAVYTVPRWHALVGAPFDAAGTSAGSAVAVYAGYTLMTVVRTLTYWSVITKLGPLLGGLGGALRTVAVFFLSALIFCSNSEAQCLNRFKVASAVIVVAGVLLYQLGCPCTRKPSQERADGKGE